MSQKNRLTITKSMPGVIDAFMQVEGLVHQSTINPLLRHLIKLRVSQINGCAYCVNMHTKEARDDGETNQRLDHLVVWRQVDFYSPAEKSALAWAEALTVSGKGYALDPLHADLQHHFSSDEIDALTITTIMINNWNRMQIANHNVSF